MGQDEARGVRWSALGAAVALVLAAGVAARVPWHGPIIVSLSSGHGVSTGDLLPLALVAAAGWVAARWWSRRRGTAGPVAVVRSAPRAGPAAAIVVGVLLVVVTVVDLTDRGPLVPAGGGTFDGTVEIVAGRRANPVGAWSYVALTDDGTALRLFVDGTEVASRATSGTRAVTTRPLWIGGNEPYDECFEGVIDDVRVYARALDQAEIRGDMATPVAAAPRPHGPVTGAGEAERTADLVGAYGFDTGAGTRAADASGHGNVGTVTGATWTPQGRHGGALRFDGAGDRVRVPPSASLDRPGALTLSAWVRPTASQRGWRTVVHRQRDTYFLAAGSSLTGVSGRADDGLAGAVIAAVSWLALVTTRSRGRWLGDRRHTWRVAVGAVLIGSLADVVLVPSTTLLGPALLATWFAVTATRRREAVGGWLVAATALGLTVATLAAPSAVGAWVQRDDGGVARTAAVGIAMIVAGVTVWHRAGPHVEPRPGGPHHDPPPPSF